MPALWMNGVYPNLKDSTYGTRENSLNRMLMEAVDDWSQVFPDLNTTDKLGSYLARLEPKMRELFLDVARFVGIIYKELNNIPDHLRDALAIALIFSIIDTLQESRRKYVNLSNWLQESKAAEKLAQLTDQGLKASEILRCLMDTYFASFGSTQAALDFFDNYLSSDQKRLLIQSYQTERECIIGYFGGTLRTLVPDFRDTMTVNEVKNALKDRVNVDKAFLPLCYGVTCYVDGGGCDPSIECHLNDEETLRKTLRKAIDNLLYEYRNAFVHKARLPTLAPKMNEECQFFYAAAFDHLDGHLIKHTLSLESLLNAFSVSLKSFFDSAQTVPLQSQTQV